MTSPATPAPKPTLFLSYASEDREAARRLRDTLAGAGLDVWYDENELGGGDAWDAKIRRQIRECDYFMPVISANTERRKEGYFRREWRLAVERTLDMADDVMFLLPVCIDGTTENNARVPEKFLTVQWLRVTEQSSTGALETLARRLAAGEHLQPTPPRGRTEPPISRSAPSAQTASAPEGASAADESHEGPPPMPPFPTHSEKGIGPLFKFFAEVIWWVVTAAWLLLRRAPKFVRVLLIIWFCFSFFSYCTRSCTRNSSNAERKEKPTASESRTPGQAKVELAKATQSLKDSGLPAELATLGAEFAKRVAAELKDSEASDKQIVAVPFHSGVTNEADAKLLTDIFAPLWGRLSIERAGHTGLISTPLPSPSNAALTAIGKKLDSTYVLGARLVRTPAPAAPTTTTPEPIIPTPEATLEVVLMHVEDGAVTWSGEYSLKDADPTALANHIAEALLTKTPKP